MDSIHPKSITISRRSAIIAKELNKYNIDIAALQETHLKDSGQFEEKSEGYTYLWSGCAEGEENHYGVSICVRSDLLKKGVITETCCYSDRMMSIKINEQSTETVLVCCYAPTLNDDVNTIEAFYENLESVIKDIPKNRGLIIAGDFNARVGDDYALWKGVLGKHGIGKMKKKNESKWTPLTSTLCSGRININQYLVSTKEYLEIYLAAS